MRQCDILLQIFDDNFLREAARLDNYNDWMQAEREFRLCRTLRVALRSEGNANRIRTATRLSVARWAAASRTKPSEFLQIES